MPHQESAGLTALGAVLSPLEGGGPKTEAVVQRLSAAISLGVMADGQQLPSETDLANQLGVSTMTLREALAVLRQQGIVHTKRGRGEAASSAARRKSSRTPRWCGCSR